MKLSQDKAVWPKKLTGFYGIAWPFLRLVPVIFGKFITVAKSFLVTYEITVLRFTYFSSRLWFWLGTLDILLAVAGYPDIVIPRNMAKIKYYIVTYLISLYTRSRIRRAILVRDSKCRPLEHHKGGIWGSWQYLIGKWMEKPADRPDPDHVLISTLLARAKVKTGTLRLGIVDFACSEDSTVVRYVMRHMVELFSVKATANANKRALLGDSCCTTAEGKDWQNQRRKWLMLMIRDGERDGKIAMRHGEHLTNITIAGGQRHNVDDYVRIVLAGWLHEHL